MTTEEQIKDGITKGIEKFQRALNLQKELVELEKELKLLGLKLPKFGATTTTTRTRTSKLECTEENLEKVLVEKMKKTELAKRFKGNSKEVTKFLDEMTAKNKPFKQEKVKNERGADSIVFSKR